MVVANATRASNSCAKEDSATHAHPLVLRLLLGRVGHMEEVHSRLAAEHRQERHCRQAGCQQVQEQPPARVEVHRKPGRCRRLQRTFASPPEPAQGSAGPLFRLPVDASRLQCHRVHAGSRWGALGTQHSCVCFLKDRQALRQTQTHLDLLQMNHVSDGTVKDFLSNDAANDVHIQHADVGQLRAAQTSLHVSIVWPASRAGSQAFLTGQFGALGCTGSARRPHLLVATRGLLGQLMSRLAVVVR